MSKGECSAVIVVETKDAFHLAKALEPDNKKAPPHILVRCSAVNEKLLCYVIVKDCTNPKRILTLRNTIDDLLSSLKASADAIG